MACIVTFHLACCVLCSGTALAHARACRPAGCLREYPCTKWSTPVVQHTTYNTVRCGAMRHCGAGYAQSLAVLATAKRASNDSLLTKSSIMLGVGESGTVAVLRVLTATSTDCDRIAAAVVYVVLRRVSPVDGHSSQRIVYRCTQKGYSIRTVYGGRGSLGGAIPFGCDSCDSSDRAWLGLAWLCRFDPIALSAICQ